MIAPDAKTVAYIEGRPRAPKGELLARAREAWLNLRSDANAVFDKEVFLDVGEIAPMVTWEPVECRRRRSPQGFPTPNPRPIHRVVRQPVGRCLIWGCKPARRSTASPSATPSSAPAPIHASRTCATPRGCSPGARSPRRSCARGSGLDRRARAGKAEGIAAIFEAAGFEWRQSGCSMCLAMNDDVLAPGDRCASSTNRNFEGRQGAGAPPI